MMRLAVLADVHGNLPALEAVLADVQRYDVDGVIVAGDTIGGGPQSVEAIQLLRCWKAFRSPPILRAQRGNES